MTNVKSKPSTYFKLKDYSKPNILVVNGPNLNFLGIREKHFYGDKNYNYLCNMIRERFPNDVIDIFQSNHEGSIIDRIQKSYSENINGIVINPGAFAHYSYAIYDALKSIDPIIRVEVHITDISNREEFRKISVTASACDKLIYGHGLEGYIEAINYIKENKNER